MNQATLDLHQRAVDQLIQEMDGVDEALGAHLLGDLGARGTLRGCECREAVLRWCASPATRAAHSAEVLDATAYAMEAMESRLLVSLVRGLMDEARRSGPATAA